MTSGGLDKRCRGTKQAQSKNLYKHGITMVLEERVGGRHGCGEPDCSESGARGLKPKADSALNQLCNLISVT